MHDMNIEKQEKQRIKYLEAQIKGQPKEIKEQYTPSIIEKTINKKKVITPVSISYDRNTTKPIGEIISDIYIQHQKLMDEFNRIKEKTLSYKYRARINNIEIDYLKRQIDELRETEIKDLPSENLNSVSIFIPVK